jgi:hypothetical protein
MLERIDGNGVHTIIGGATLATSSAGRTGPTTREGARPLVSLLLRSGPSHTT